MTTRTGRCMCGSITYEVTGDPLFVGICHCKDCQRQGGTAFSHLMGVTSEQLKVSGDTLKEFVTEADSGGQAIRKFCGNCGSPIYSQPSSNAGMSVIKTGTLDDTSGLPPQMHVWCSSAMDWVDLPTDIPTMQKQS
jgi:hypothetical protein